MCEFSVGEVVVCVDDSPNLCGSPCPIKRGSLYRIADIIRCDCLSCGGSFWVQVIGFPQHFFSPRRFAPIRSEEDEVTRMIRRSRPHDISPYEPSRPKVPAREREDA